MLRNLVAALTILVIGGQVVGQTAPKKPDDKALVTKVYDLKSLLGERGKASGFADMNAVIKMIVEEVLPAIELKPGTEGPQLIEREGGKLEVRATAKSQEEIGDLIEAMIRLTDLAVNVKADVIELDAATYEKWLKAVPTSAKGKPGSPLPFAIQDFDEMEPTDEEKQAFAASHKILRSGKLVQTSTTRFANGVEGTFSARQSVQTFHQHIVNKKQTEPPLFVKEGFKLIGLPVVSADRRFIRLKLTEQSTVVVGIKRREIEVIKDQKLVMSSLETEDLGSTGSTTLADGSTAVFRLAYAPKDKVWLVVLQPTIFIQAEEDFRKKEEKK